MASRHTEVRWQSGCQVVLWTCGMILTIRLHFRWLVSNTQWTRHEDWFREVGRATGLRSMGDPATTWVLRGRRLAISVSFCVGSCAAYLQNPHDWSWLCVMYCDVLRSCAKAAPRTGNQNQHILAVRTSTTNPCQSLPNCQAYGHHQFAAVDSKRRSTIH